MNEQHFDHFSRLGALPRDAQELNKEVANNPLCDFMIALCLFVLQPTNGNSETLHQF